MLKLRASGCQSHKNCLTVPSHSHLPVVVALPTLKFGPRDSIVSAGIGFPENCRHNTIQRIARVVFNLIKARFDKSVIAPKYLQVSTL
jgi:hypothetical protein